MSDVQASPWYSNVDNVWRWPFFGLGASIIVQFLGVWVTLALPRAWKLGAHFFNLVARYDERTERRWPGFTGYDTGRTIEHEVGEQLARCVHEAARVRPGAIQLPEYRQQEPRRPIPWRQVGVALSRLALGLFLFAIFAGVMAGGVLIAYLQIDNVVLSRAEKGGIYLPVGGFNDTRLLEITTPYEFQTETDSAAYANDCYDSKDELTTCTRFLQTEIDYSVKHGDDCPFLESAMCYLGPNSAFSITTGPLSARSIGINTARRFEFQRSATFSPLNMNDTYISRSNRTDGIYTYSYNYGIDVSNPFSNVSWITYTHGDLAERTPAYSMGAMFYKEGFSSPSTSPPIPELSTGTRGSWLTLMMILPGKIYHAQPSHDPIFSATHPAGPFGKQGLFYIYNEGYARPLAAVDTIQWRDLDISPEWHDVGDIPSDQPGETPPALWLLWYAIQNSYTYTSIGRRLGSGLIASSRINAFISLPLEQEQWKVEALNMFKTSLARIQIDAYNIARGIKSQYPGYVLRNQTPAEDTYIFNFPEVSNVDGGSWLGIFLTTTVIILASLPWFKTHENEEVLVGDLICFGHADYCAYKLFSFGAWVVHVVPKAVIAIWSAAVKYLFTPLWTGLCAVMNFLGRLLRDLRAT